MAQTSLRVYAKNFAMVDSDTPNTHIDVVTPGPNSLVSDYANGGRWMLFQFDDPTESLGTQRLLDVKAVFSTGLSAANAWINPLKGNYNKDTITWNTKPGYYDDIGSPVGGRGTPREDRTYTTGSTAIAKSRVAKEFIEFCGGIFVPAQKSNSFYLFTELTDSSIPYLEIFYDDEETVNGKIALKSGPVSGYRNPREPISFTWGYERVGDYFCAAEFTQTSAILYWKESEAETYNEIDISGNQQKVTVPANTFPAGTTIQWYVQGTEAGGLTSQTGIYSFSTTAGEVTATQVSPINTIKANNDKIAFKWKYTSADGFQPSRYQLWWKLPSEDSSQWHQLADSTDVVSEYVVPENTFPVGEIQWIVRPYNIDGTLGAYTNASFISYGAPDTPVVYATDVPYTTITWQAEDQQAYQIKVDERIYGPYFGEEKSFALPDYLEDGEHIVSVAVAGSYALWSQWGTTVIDIQNAPGDEIVLGGISGIDNFLSWITAEETSDFRIFRDNVQIGRTAEISFTDRYAAGDHTYKVINRLPDGNYSESNVVMLHANIDGTYISLLRGGEWLKIKYMLKNASDQEYEESVETVYNHLAGDYYPSVSISGYRERKLNYSAVFPFTEEADHAVFKSFLRKPVVMKFENGNIIAGVIDSWTVLHRKHYYTAYTFSLRQIEWEDYVDDTT